MFIPSSKRIRFLYGWIRLRIRGFSLEVGSGSSQPVSPTLLWVQPSPLSTLGMKDRCLTIYELPSNMSTMGLKDYNHKFANCLDFMKSSSGDPSFTKVNVLFDLKVIVQSILGPIT